MWTLSKFFILCLLLCLAFGCNSGSDSAVDGGSTDTETETDTGTGSDTGTGTEEPDTTEGLDDCEIMEAIIQNAVDKYCEKFIDTCCYCLCWDKDKGFDSEEYFDNGECVCVDNPDPQECEDAYLEQAEACVADMEACHQLYYDAAETGCLMTPLK